jgi:hypothetical protein
MLDNCRSSIGMLHNFSAFFDLLIVHSTSTILEIPAKDIILHIIELTVHRIEWMSQGLITTQDFNEKKKQKNFHFRKNSNKTIQKFIIQISTEKSKKTF